MASPAFTLLDDSTTRARVGARPSVVALGNFDGVHLGHQTVLEEAARDAAAGGLASYVLTFDPHPSEALGRGAPPALTTLPRRADLLLRAGVERVFVRRFDAGFAAWEPERFARELLAEWLCARHVVVGANFRFGAGAVGDLAMLAELGAKFGFEAHAHGITGDDAGPYSSTRVRAAIAAGDVTEATRVLGRPHAISGIVGRGAQRGRAIGFPTANLEKIPEVLPGDGVYAIAVDELLKAPDGTESARALEPGVMNVGVRPTLGGAQARTVEAHLFDFDRDLYGALLRVHVLRRLRDEMKFAGLDELKAQIAKDAEAARDITKAMPIRGGAYG